MGPVANKSGTEEEIAFFSCLLCLSSLCMHCVEMVNCLGFLSWKAGVSAAAPSLLEDLIQSSGQKLGWQCYCCIQTKQGAHLVGIIMVLNETTNVQTKSECSACDLRISKVYGVVLQI